MGIGRSLARELASRGYDLIICSARERLDSAAAELQSTGVHVFAVSADLARREGVEQLWQRVQSIGRPLAVACINAGIGVGGQFWETSLEQLQLIELNCVGTVHLAKYVVRDMVSRAAGRILITSSIAGEMVAPREAVYAASKTFDLSFAHSLRYELRDIA